MAIADDDLHERTRHPDPLAEQRRPDDAAERYGPTLETGRTTAAPPKHRSLWVIIAGVGAASSLALAGFVAWPSGEPSAASIVRSALETSIELASFQAVGQESEPGVGEESWSVRVDGTDASYVSRAVLDEGRTEESVVTYFGDAVYVMTQGETEIRSRDRAEGVDTRYHELVAALTSALDGADVTEADTEVFGGAELTRYYVVLTQRSIASLSGGGSAGPIEDPEEIEELRVCVEDGHHMHELHFIYRDGRTIDVSVTSVNGDITITPPDGVGG